MRLITRFLPCITLLIIIAANLNEMAKSMVHDKSQIFVPTASLVSVLIEQKVPAIFLGNNHEVKQEVKEKASFNGFVLDSNGHIAFFVGEYRLSMQPSKISFLVKTRENQTYPAQPVGIDNRISLAVIRTELPDTIPLFLSSKSSFKHFNMTPAVNSSCAPSPFCLLDRSYESWFPFSVLKGFGLPNRIQSCSLTGSLALDLNGKLLGIVSHASPHRYNKKLLYTYILPSKLIESSAAKIVRDGKNISAGWLGIYLTDNKQPTVDWVTPKSPAKMAGLQPQDIIMRIDGHKIRSKFEFVHAIRFKGAGREVILDILRGSSDEKITVETVNRKPTYAASWVIDLGLDSKTYPTRTSSPKAHRMGWNPLMDLGLIVYPFNPFSVSTPFQFRDGFLIKSILRQSPASEVGFKTGDIIFRINGTYLNSFEDLMESIEHSPKNKLRIYYFREGKIKSSLLRTKP